MPRQMKGVTMAVEPSGDGGLGLVEFLADLRADLEAAQTRAQEGDGPGGGLRLAVEQVTVTLEVAHVATTSGELSGKVAGKFWVFGSAEVASKGALQRERSGTQTLELTLRPRVETVSVDAQGNPVTTSEGLDVDSPMTGAEQSATIPLADAV